MDEKAKVVSMAKAEHIGNEDFGRKNDRPGRKDIYKQRSHRLY